MKFLSRLFGWPTATKHVHDWEVICCEHISHIKWRVDQELGKQPQWPPVPIPSSTYGLERKVCLTCGECRDEITECENDYRAEIAVQQKRKATAVELWNWNTGQAQNGAPIAERSATLGD